MLDDRPPVCVQWIPLSAGGTSIVDRINYAQNKDVIDRLTLAIQATRSIGFAVVILFTIASMEKRRSRLARR